MFSDVSLYLPYVNDCLLFMKSTEEMSNLVIKSEFIYCLIFVILIPENVCCMIRLIPDCNMSLDADTIFTAHAQLVSKALGVSWVMPLKQRLSWLNSLGSLINNICPMLCYPSVFDNG